MEYSANFFSSFWGGLIGLAQYGRAGVLMALLATLAACGGSDAVITQNDLAEPASDGVAPTLEMVSIKMSKSGPKPNGTAKLGQDVQIDIFASEAIMAPIVRINGVEVDEISGSVREWSAKRKMTEFDLDGEVTFSISFEDVSGEVGVDVTSTTDGSAVQYCIEGCPENAGSLAGDWYLDGDGAVGVGPVAGDTSWWASTAAERPCWYDDIHRFGEDGSFLNVLGDETWVEEWQSGVPDACGTPVAPHDGSSVGSYVYDESKSTLTIQGKGSHIALAKAVNGAELASPALAPEAITYDVLTLDGDSMTLSVDIGGGYWTFKLKRAPASPVAGKWKLDGDGAVGVGPVAGDTSWWASTAADRPCWYDDVYEFGSDGSYSNIHGDKTWVEEWQSGIPDECATPVAPHDGNNDAVYSYDEEASTLTVLGKGAYVALPKAVNGAELTSPADAPDSITYDVLTLDGDSMTLSVDIDGGSWTFKLKRVSNSPLKGNWKLDGDGAVGVGPVAGDTSWWASTEVDRPCWYDDIMHFGDDGTFLNALGGKTWVEEWQSGVPDACGTPVAPHDGSSTGSYMYDGDAGKLTISGVGSHIALPKAVNGAELTSPAEAPEAITYDILTLDGDSMTLSVDIDGGAWTFRVIKD
jgi:hypothetical protein